MERRVLLAVLLSFLVLYGYQALFPPPPDASHKPEQSSKVATAPNASAAEHANPAPSVVAPAAPAPGVPSAPGRDIVLDNAAVHAVFTTRGGVIKSWQLKKFHDAQGRPLEMIAGHAPPDAPLPFSLTLDDPAPAARLSAADFTATTDPGAGDGRWQARFDYSDAAGLRVTKTFSETAANPYVLSVNVAVSQNGTPLAPTLEWGPALGSGIVIKSRTYNPAPQPVFYKDGKVSRITPAKIAAQPVQEGTFGFAGVDDHYFIIAVVKPTTALKIDYAALDVPLPDEPAGAHYVSWSVRFPGPAAVATYFIGPKDFDVLASVDRDMVRAIDFGIFGWLVVPLLRALKWINAYVGNYGWSLIILTILINLAMFPLRHKSVVSMRKMQEIQPEVKAIQERYAKLKISDPARSKMNTEMMALYKERGVNPASGCVPMVLTMPVLFAFYSLLSVAIELRGAPFMFWIKDLSAHDPLFITPVIMGVTMFVQQRMTPTAADATQQKMMMWMMPIMMTGMFLWAASGLVIYWTVSNVWGIGQQMITNRIIGPTTQRSLRPPAERRVKNAGAGKTDQAAASTPADKSKR